MCNSQVSHIADNQCVGIGMLLEVVGFCLLEVTQITDTQLSTQEPEVESEHLAKRWSVEGSGHHGVVLVVAS